MNEQSLAVSRSPRAAASDPKAFVARVKFLTVAGSIAAFGIVWGFVASNAVGVTSRATALGTGTGTGTDPNAGGGTPTGPDRSTPRGADFFAGGAGQAPTFPDPAQAGGGPANGGGREQLPTVDGWGSLGAGGAGGGTRSLGGPVMRSGGS